MRLSKNVSNLKCAPKFVFFNEKIIRKIRMIFDFKNWLWKSNFHTFWHLLPHYTNSQNSMISFDNSWFLAKNLFNFVSSLENSTIGIAIVRKPDLCQTTAMSEMFIDQKRQQEWLNYEIYVLRRAITSRSLYIFIPFCTAVYILEQFIKQIIFHDSFFIQFATKF